jgi:hypothetical protein
VLPPLTAAVCETLCFPPQLFVFCEVSLCLNWRQAPAAAADDSSREEQAGSAKFRSTRDVNFDKSYFPKTVAAEGHQMGPVCTPLGAVTRGVTLSCTLTWIGCCGHVVTNTCKYVRESDLGQVVALFTPAAATGTQPLLPILFLPAI